MINDYVNGVNGGDNDDNNKDYIDADASMQQDDLYIRIMMIMMTIIMKI